MESNHQVVHFNVNQEDQVDQPEHDEKSSLGIGRSYECVFCKRGFNTAQALGGHMNIHRKDRARNKPASSLMNSNNIIIHNNNNIIDDDDDDDDDLDQINTYQPHHQHYQLPIPSDHDQQFNINHRSSAATAAQPAAFFPNYHHNYFFNNQVRFNPFGFDQWSMSFNMPCGSSAHVEDIENSRSRGVTTQEEELDLELRLGAP